MKKFVGFFLFLFLFSLNGYSQFADHFLRSKLIRYHAPEFLTYDELVTLSGDPSPGGKLGEKV